MVTLNLTTQTGTFSTTPGANGVIASSGPIGPNTSVSVLYCLSGASGTFQGYEIFKGNFNTPIVFPGTQLRFDLIKPDDYCGINIEASATP